MHLDFQSKFEYHKRISLKLTIQLSNSWHFQRWYSWEQAGKKNLQQDLKTLKRKNDDARLNRRTNTCFGTCYDQGFSEITFHLSSQKMEQVCRGWREGNRHIGILNIFDKVLILQFKSFFVIFLCFFQVRKTSVRISHLKEPLESTTRMFRSSPIKAMRKNKCKTWLSKPFVFTVRKEDINYYLSCIEEISKLSLPNRQIVRIIDWVSILEGHNCVFRKSTVQNLDVTSAGLLSCKVFDRTEKSLSALIDKFEMSLWESAALDILSRETNIISLSIETEKSQSLTSSPVKFVLLDSFYSFVNMEFFDSRMDFKIWRNKTSSLSVLLQSV